MIGVAMYITIKSLWERHKNKSLIARLTGHDWKTVAKRIKEIEEGEEYLIPLLEKIIASYPYRIMNFHADNSSEYINSKVAEMLNNLLIKLTKGRPRHTKR